jgi:hypothetical protein
MRSNAKRGANGQPLQVSTPLALSFLLPRFGSTVAVVIGRMLRGSRISAARFNDCRGVWQVEGGNPRDQMGEGCNIHGNMVVKRVRVCIARSASLRSFLGTFRECSDGC